MASHQLVIAPAAQNDLKDIYQYRRFMRDNTMKNTMLRKSFKMLEKLLIERSHTAP